jgi:selenocysteine-specific elongation factor
MKHFIVATAGHVDHGKSSLVKALTGTDPDRLPEEKARQITIDLGFAELNLGDDIHAAIVDVPGHEDFVRNMIAGVGSIDLALFVVAADDGWMPQTEEHLQILQYLGVERAVIALTKIDIGDADRVEAQICEKLRETSFATAPIVKTSLANPTALSGQVSSGAQALKEVLATELSRISTPRDIGKPRLFVDRAFTLHGIGTVITGTLTGGTFRQGDKVVIQPRNLPARVRSLQSHGREVDLAVPGTRTAINLPELEIGHDIQRGDVVAAAELENSSLLGVGLEKSSRSPARPLKNHARVYLHHGTARVAAQVALLDDEVLERGKKSIARLRLEFPIAAFLGDRFVLRDPSEQFTVAGGIVLDPSGNCARELLRQRAVAPNDVEISVRTELEQRGAVPMSILLRESFFSAEEVRTAVKQLDAALPNDLAVDPGKWKSLREQAVALIDRAHRHSPDRPGLELNELRTALRDKPSELIDALIDDLCAHDFVRARSTIARQSHRSALPAAMHSIAQGLRDKLSEKPFDPPARKQIAADVQTRNVLRFLIEQGEAIDIAPDVVLSREAFAQMKTAIVAFLQKHGTATVSQLRQEIQTSRRIMVPMLELLDAQKLTRREGDKRLLA